MYIRKIVIKMELGHNLTKMREYLIHYREALLQDSRYRSLLIYFDVDPL